MTSLIDVIFLLLLFFMLSSTFSRFAEVEISAGFEFDVPVRFDTDRIQTSVASFQAGDMPNVPVVEIRV